MTDFTARELALIAEVYNIERDYDYLPMYLQDKLYDHFSPRMPYGVAKARDGDPVHWVMDHLEELI